MKKISSFFLGLFVFGALAGQEQSREHKLDHSSHKKSLRELRKTHSRDHITHTPTKNNHPYSYVPFQSSNINPPRSVSCSSSSLKGNRLYAADSLPETTSSADFCSVLEWYLGVQEKSLEYPGINHKKISAKDLAVQTSIFLGDQATYHKGNLQVSPLVLKNALELALIDQVDPKSLYINDRNPIYKSDHYCVAWHAYPITVSIMATLGLYPPQHQQNDYWCNYENDLRGKCKEMQINFPNDIHFLDGSSCTSFEDCLTKAIEKCSGPYLESKECVWYVDKSGESPIQNLCAMGNYYDGSLPSNLQALCGGDQPYIINNLPHGPSPCPPLKLPPKGTGFKPLPRDFVPAAVAKDLIKASKA